MNTVVRLFEHYNDADRAVHALHDYGVENGRISVITRDTGTIHGKNAAVPAAKTGAVAGGLVGLIAGVSALIVPGIGPVIATGTIASALASTLGMTAIGAGFGAATGGILGALIDLGFSQKDAEEYAEGVYRGGVLVSVRTDSEDEDQISEILSSAGAVDMDTHSQIEQLEDEVELEDTENIDEEAHRY